MESHDDQVLSRRRVMAPGRIRATVAMVLLVALTAAGGGISAAADGPSGSTGAAGVAGAANGAVAALTIAATDRTSGLSSPQPCGRGRTSKAVTSPSR